MQGHGFLVRDNTLEHRNRGQKAISSHRLLSIQGWERHHASVLVLQIELGLNIRFVATVQMTSWGG